MLTEVIQIKTALGLKVFSPKQLDADKFINMLLQCMDNNQALFYTFDFIIADFSNVTEHDMSLNDVVEFTQKVQHHEKQFSNSLLLSIAVKNNELYKLFTAWKEMHSDSKSLQSGIFRDIDRATQWTEMKF